MTTNIDMELLKKDAVDIFHQGFACSESVIYAIRKHFELDMSDDAIAMSSGFPWGLGGGGCICGALAGGTMCIVISIVIYIKGMFIPYGGSFCIWYIPFFFGGYLSSKYKKYIENWKSRIYFISMLLFIPISYFWKRVGDSEIKYILRKTRFK